MQHQVSTRIGSTRKLPRVWFQATLAPIAIGIFALALRVVHLDGPAHFDELYHLLAARGWLASGEFAIAEGYYTRSSLFTRLLAFLFDHLGESLVVARLPSVIAGSLLVVAVFVWTRREAGAVAAWVAALLLAVWSDAIAISQFARFYAAHGLFVFLGASAVYVVVHYQRSPLAQLGLVLTAGVSFLLALALQVTTLIALLGLGVWLALAVALPWLIRSRLAPAWKCGAGLAVLGLGLTLVMSELGQYAWEQMSATALWAARHENRFWYYHGLLSLSHPLLWSLVGVTAIFALAHRPRQALFCAVFFATTFLIHSLAAAKHIRYFYYAVPFLFVLAAIAVQAVLPRLWSALVATAGQAAAAIGLARAHARRDAALAGFACVFALAAQPDLVRSAAGLAGIYLPPERPPPDWGAVQPALEPWLAQADVVLTTNELAALYYLGRYDLLISRSRLNETGNSKEFARDYRTGRPVVSTPAAVARIMDCHATGLVVTEEGRWRNSIQLDDEVADLIVRRAQEIPLSPRHRMRAYHWRGAPATPERCVDLPALPGREAAGSG